MALHASCQKFELKSDGRKCSLKKIMYKKSLFINNTPIHKYIPIENTTAISMMVKLELFIKRNLEYSAL